MIKYVVLVLTVGSILHGKHVDVYEHEYSVTKTVDKRQFIEAETKQIASAEKNPNKKKSESAGKEDATSENKARGVLSNPAKVEGIKDNATMVEVASKPVVKIQPAHDSVLPHSKEEHEHNGALLRSLYVFLGLSVLVMGYLGFRAFRVRPGASAPTTVRKYGVVGRRSDMEMLPLPLNEEEDDDTLFEVHQTGQQTQ